MIQRRSNLIGLIFVFFWIFFSIFYAYQKEISFSLVVIPHRSNVQLYKKKVSPGNFKVQGIFRANENNMGIVFVKSEVNTGIRRENSFTFRLKERGSPHWYYQSHRRLRPNLTYFPYGFPIIRNSKGKEYVFEIQTNSQTYISAIQSNIFSPAVQIGYQYPKNEILESGRTLLLFSLLKLSSWLQNFDFVLVSLLLTLPALYFYKGRQAKELYEQLIMTIIKSKKRYPFSGDVKGVVMSLHNAEKIKPVIPFLFILATTTILLEDLNNLVIILILSIWVFVVRKLRFSSRNSFMMTVALLIFTAFSAAFGWTNVAIKASIWIFMFLAFGVIQAVFEVRKESDEKK